MASTFMLTCELFSPQRKAIVLCLHDVFRHHRMAAAVTVAAIMKISAVYLTTRTERTCNNQTTVFCFLNHKKSFERPKYCVYECFSLFLEVIAT